MADLRTLGELIFQSIRTIESRLQQEDLNFPALTEPFDPSGRAESVLLEPEISLARSCIVAAASQLIAMVRSPVVSLIESGLLFHLSSCIRAAVESNMVEIIKEAAHCSVKKLTPNLKGIHVKEIAQKNHTDPAKAGEASLIHTGRILRLLANHHIFTEINPDVFSLNRLSSVLDSGNSSARLQKKDKYAPASIDFATKSDRLNRTEGSAYLSEAFMNPTTAHSVKATDSPWNLSAKTDKFLFDWYDLPENAMRKARFSFAMACSTSLEPPGAVLSGFKWETLPQDALIVDVGGGVGSTALQIAQATPHVKIVVQDRASVITDATIYLERSGPDLLKSGNLKLEVHDFFNQQPDRNVAVFLLRWILHDWADPAAIYILQTLRKAATTETKLVVMEVIIPYTCRDSTTTDIFGAIAPSAPAPLLSNMGSASNMKYFLDLQMFVLGNCQERTLGQLVCLARSSGWSISEVHHITGSTLSQCILVPV
ncbi:O-methyltransferase [Mycena leptocephala]|nr:O-methyltransferase [Mycena leptocephala]